MYGFLELTQVFGFKYAMLFVDLKLDLKLKKEMTSHENGTGNISCICPCIHWCTNQDMLVKLCIPQEISQSGPLYQRVGVVRQVLTSKALERSPKTTCEPQESPSCSQRCCCSSPKGVKLTLLLGASQEVGQDGHTSVSTSTHMMYSRALMNSCEGGGVIGTACYVGETPIIEEETHI